MGDHQKTPLLSECQGAVPPHLPSPADARRITVEFFLMASAFSINHGTVTG
jgi:hypothetical protein